MIGSLALLYTNSSLVIATTGESFLTKAATSLILRGLSIRYFCDQGSANLRYDQGSEEVMHLGLSCPGVVCR